MKIKIKKSHPNAITPRRAKDGDAAYDLFCVERTVIKPMERKIFHVSVLENTAREEDQEPFQHECAFARRKVRALSYALQRV